VIDLLVQKRRGKNAALRLLHCRDGQEDHRHRRLDRARIAGLPLFASGPTGVAIGQTLPNRSGSDIVASADVSLVHAGVLAAETRSIAVAVLNGRLRVAHRLTGS